MWRLVNSRLLSQRIASAMRFGGSRGLLHMQAMAIDIRIPGVPTTQLRDAALALHRGGVGYYAASNFVHVDVGRVRHW